MCRKLLFAIALVALVAGSAQATSWTGATDNNWPTNGNWDANAPTTGVIAILDGANDAGDDIANLTGAGACSTLTLTGMTLNVGGTLTGGGNVTLGLGATSTLNVTGSYAVGGHITGDNAVGSLIDINGGTVNMLKMRLSSDAGQVAPTVKVRNGGQLVLNHAFQLGGGDIDTTSYRAKLEVNGGTIINMDTRAFMIGMQGGARLDMIDGLIDTNAVVFIGKHDWDNPVTHAELTGGLIKAPNLYAGQGDYIQNPTSVGISAGASMNITGGTLILEGDKTAYINCYVTGNGYYSNLTGTVGTVKVDEFHSDWGRAWLTGYGVAAFSDGTSTGVLCTYDDEESITIVTAIPEPTTIALLGLGGLLLIRRKRS